MNLPRCETCNIDLHGRDVTFDGSDFRCRQCDNPVLLDDARHRKQRRFKRSTQDGVPPGVSVERLPTGDGNTSLRLRVPWHMQRPDDGLHLTGWILVAVVVLGGLELGWGKPLAFTLGAFLIFSFSAFRRINHTTILVEPTSIRISHGPIPWFWRRFDPSHMEQLYVARRPIAQRVFDYCVRARLNTDQDVSFFRGLREPAVAFYLERCIEEHFEIKDRRVRGEYVEEPKPSKPESPYLD